MTGIPSSSGALRSDSATTRAPCASTAGSAAAERGPQRRRPPVGRVEEHKIVLARPAGCGVEPPHGVRADHLRLLAERLQVAPERRAGRPARRPRRWRTRPRARAPRCRARPSRRTGRAPARRRPDRRGWRTAPRAPGPRSGAWRRPPAPAAGARRSGRRSRACARPMDARACDTVAPRMPDDLEIRPFHVDDAEAVWRMRRQPGVLESTMAMPSERLDQRRRRFEALGDDDHMFVAVRHGEIAGIAGLHVEDGRRRHVGLPRHRGRGDAPAGRRGRRADAGDP